MAYIYCNYKDHSAQTASNLVGSLLKQLVQDHSAVYENVKALYRRHQCQETQPALQQLLETLRSATGIFSKVFVVVDALDECLDRTRAELLLALRSLSTINLLATSRKLPAIAQTFQEVKHFEIRASDDDVKKYIEGRIPRAGFLSIHVSEDGTLKEEMVKAITKNIDGM